MSLGKLYNVCMVIYEGKEMNMNKVLTTSVMAIAVLLAGCASDYSGNRYDGSTVGEVQRTEKGQVISLRKVELKPEHSMAGTALGAVGGGLVGSALGGGNAKLLTAAAGAVACQAELRRSRRAPPARRDPRQQARRDRHGAGAG